MARRSSSEVLEGDDLQDPRRELESLTVKELREKAKDRSVNLQGKRRKADIIDAILAATLGQTLEAIEAPEEEDAMDLDLDLPFGKLEDLWIEATNRLSEGDYKSAIALSKDGLRLLDQWSGRYRKGMCSRALHAAELFGNRLEDEGRARELRRKVKEAHKAYSSEDLDRCSLLISELQGEVADLYVEEMGKVRKILMDKERTLEELRGLDTDLSTAHEMLSAAEEALGIEDHARAQGLIQSFDEVVEETLKRRRIELESYLNSVESRLEETEGLGKPLKECRKLARQARSAFEQGDLVLASEIAQRCEKAAVEAQRKHIEMALQLRRKHYQEVRDIVSYTKPLLQEAQHYGIDIEGAKTLIKEALEFLRQESYFEAMGRAQEARRFLESLQPSIAAERAKRGIVRPERGVCSQCDSKSLTFREDGWGECASCGYRFLWSTKDQPWFISFLKRTLVR